MKTTTICSMGMAFVFLPLLSCVEDSPALLPFVTTQEYAADLNGPIGMDIDYKKRLWVTEAGTGNNDGRLTVILPDGSQFVAVDNFPSVFRAEEGISVGLNHVLAQGSTLWILHDFGFLFSLDISNIIAGQTPLDWSQLDSENIGAWVLDYEFEDDTDLSNPYNMTFGPNGNMYIADAGANAIIKREPNGNLSVLATLPRTKNPLQVGPPFVEAVPTGIVFDGSQFLVSCLLGFPFPENQAKLFAIDLEGNVSDYEDHFTSLTDIEKVSTDKYVVTEFASFALGAGWQSNTGSLLQVYQGQKTVMLDNITTPTAVVHSGNGVYFVNSFRDGTVTMLVSNRY